MPKPLPSPELLRKLLRYEPDTGKLFWRERTPDMFEDSTRSANHSCGIWNSKYANKEAFTALSFSGYANGRIFNVLLKAHRVIFAIYYGYWPINQIDHINGIKTDNRISNLREVTNRENARNAKRRSDNKSGACGVSWHKRTKKWQVRIKVDGRDKNLGSFDVFEDAVAVRKAANLKYGYHSNHGRD